MLKLKDNIDLKKLGYKRLPKRCNKNMILYERERTEIDPDCKKIIHFNINNKTVQFSPYRKYTMEELQAIIQQCKELEWL